MDREEELKLIIKALKAEMYDAFLVLNNEKDILSNNGIARTKELLKNYETAKNEINTIATSKNK